MAGSSPREIAESYWAAESRRDTRAVLEHYDREAVFRLPGQVFRGHEEIATFYDENAAIYPGLEVTIVGGVTTEDSGALEWEAKLIDPAGVAHPLRGVNVFDVQDGKFVSVRVYFDVEAPALRGPAEGA